MWVFPHFLKFTLYFVRSGGQFFWVFDPRPLCYLKHCKISKTVKFRGVLL